MKVKFPISPELKPRVLFLLRSEEAIWKDVCREARSNPRLLKSWGEQEFVELEEDLEEVQTLIQMVTDGEDFDPYWETSFWAIVDGGDLDDIEWEGFNPSLGCFN